MNKRSLLMAASLLGMAILTTPPAWSGAEWSPQISDRLVQMNVEAMDQAIKDSYRGSGLAVALADAETEVKEKMQEVARLGKALNQARDDRSRQSLQFRHLAAKKELIAMQTAVVELKVQRAKARSQMLEQLLQRVRAFDRALTPREQQLQKMQKEAAERMNNTSLQVEKAVYTDAGVRQTAYSVQSAQLDRAIAQLSAAIASHPQNRSSLDGDVALTKAEWLNHRQVETYGEIQLAEKEQQLLSFMAQKVALDARSLTEELSPGGKQGDRQAMDNDTAGMSDLFLQ